MKRYLLGVAIMVAMVACNTSTESEENDEYKQEIEHLDSLNDDLDQTQEDLDALKEEIDEVDSLLNELEL